MWRDIQDAMVHQNTFVKNTFFGRSGKYQDFRHILQNIKLSKNIIGLNNQPLTKPLYPGGIQEQDPV